MENGYRVQNMDWDRHIGGYRTRIEEVGSGRGLDRWIVDTGCRTWKG